MIPHYGSSIKQFRSLVCGILILKASYRMKQIDIFTDKQHFECYKITAAELRMRVPS